MPTARNQLTTAAVACAAVLSCAPLWAQRSLGIDVSAWQGNITSTNWTTLKNVDDRDFVFIRSSRGGTTGYYNQSDPSNSNGLNTLSQRYDDPYFVQNMTRATEAGLLAGPYHFARPDIVASTQNSGGIANTGADEADHFLQMAGAWMRPGYLLPVYDFEAGAGIRTPAELTQFSIDFSNRIYEATGVRPIIYTGGNYVANHSLEPIQEYFPVLWAARWPNQDNPDAIPVQTGHPKDSYAGFYGPWDALPDAGPHPWGFWQYASTARLTGYKNGGANIDVNVAHGGQEFLRDNLVPALWVTDSDGDWSSLENWNSGQAPVAPVQGPGQVPRVGPLTLPAARLPGPLDTVVLDRTAASVAVTLGAGTHEVRKLVTREALNLDGGSLTVNYTPVAESTPYSALFAAPVSLGGASLSVHTLQVDPTGVLTLADGDLTFDTITLTPANSNPGKITVTGEVTLAPLGATTAKVQHGAGFGFQGEVSLGGATRSVHVLDGAPDVDVSIDVPINSGTLQKTGPGVLRLTASNNQSGTLVSEGTLLVANTTGSATGGTAVQVDAGATLGGDGSIAGSVTVDGVLAPGASVGTLSVGLLTLDAGSTLQVEIDSAVSFDRVEVGGTVTIDPSAMVEVAFAPGFTPVFGQSFVVVDAGVGVNGSFGGVTTNGPAMAARSVAGGVVLEVLSGLAGDFNNDGAVDGADFTLWSESYGGPASALLNTGGAESVDAALYTMWRDNLGASLSTMSQAVPEPLSAAPLALALLSAPRRK